MIPMKTSHQIRLVALALLAQHGAAYATSPQETAILKAPMAHQIYSGGTPVKVHRARLEGYFEGKTGNAAALADLKKQVGACTKSLAASGRALHPPTEWPDYMMVEREEQYVAANRSIRYTSGATYGVSGADCSLVSEVVSMATLASSKGVCKIDLAKKTARGDCDPSGHADAAPERRGPVQPSAEIMKMMASNPAIAAAMPQLKDLGAMNAVRGGQRTILGVRCNVWIQPVDSEGTKATLCYAVGGSFLAPRAVDPDGFGGLLLESTTPQGYQLKAIDARLDTEVGNAVFAPYARGGFAINADGGGQ